ncbi:MAG: ABC transporter substrate-binding protein [Rhodospirillales bacterium]|nr:ABC transporter substrate-binding protein [Rhodospirillales bacterium]
MRSASKTTARFVPGDPRIDAVGVGHQTAVAPRIVSLVPSVTELLFALDLGERVVGRTVFCVHPKDRIGDVPSVGGTKSINIAKLRRLAPTHIVVNIDETPRALADELTNEGYEIVVTHPVEVRDNLALYRLLGNTFARIEAAEALCQRFEDAIASAQATAAERPRRSALYLIWKNPWMTVARDTYISRMLALAGIDTLPALADRRYPQMEIDDALLDRCHLVLLSSEPFPFDEHHRQEFIEAHPQHSAKVHPIDAQMVSWYGSRAISGLTYLAQFTDSLKEEAA